MTDVNPVLPAETLVGFIDQMDRILDTEEHWTKLTGARDTAGFPTPPSGEGAVAWCLIGAAWRVTEPPYRYDFSERMTAHRDVLMCFRMAIDARGIGLTTSEFNDESSFEDIKALILEARAIAGQPFDRDAVTKSIARTHDPKARREA